MFKKIVCVGVLLIMLFSLAACSAEGKDMGLKAGFEKGSGEPAPPIKVEVISEKSRLKVGEDLTVKLCYGSLSSYDRYDPAPVSVTAKIFMGHSVYGDKSPWGGSYASTLIEQFVLKEIDDFADSMYLWQNKQASETIVIPADWFAGERGGIGWSVTAHIIPSEDSPQEEWSEGGGVALYYRIKGENIILYDTYYNFYNDIREGNCMNCGG